MPLKIFVGKALWIKPNTNWQTVNLTNQSNKISVDKNFYITIQNNTFQ